VSSCLFINFKTTKERQGPDSYRDHKGTQRKESLEAQYAIIVLNK